MIETLQGLLVIVGLFYALRVPYLLIFAQYVAGREYSEIHKGVENMLIGRGTSSFWFHCLRHVFIAVVIVVLCYFGILSLG